MTQEDFKKWLLKNVVWVVGEVGSLEKSPVSRWIHETEQMFKVGTDGDVIWRMKNYGDDAVTEPLPDWAKEFEANLNNKFKEGVMVDGEMCLDILGEQNGNNGIQKVA